MPPLSPPRHTAPAGTVGRRSCSALLADVAEALGTARAVRARRAQPMAAGVAARLQLQLAEAAGRLSVSGQELQSRCAAGVGLAIRTAPTAPAWTRRWAETEEVLRGDADALDEAAAIVEREAAALTRTPAPAPATQLTPPRSAAAPPWQPPCRRPTPHASPTRAAALSPRAAASPRVAASPRAAAEAGELHRQVGELRAALQQAEQRSAEERRALQLQLCTQQEELRALRELPCPALSPGTPPGPRTGPRPAPAPQVGGSSMPSPDPRAGALSEEDAALFTPVSSPTAQAGHTPQRSCQEDGRVSPCPALASAPAPAPAPAPLPLPPAAEGGGPGAVGTWAVSRSGAPPERGDILSLGEISGAAAAQPSGVHAAPGAAGAEGSPAPERSTTSPAAGPSAPPAAFSASSALELAELLRLVPGAPLPPTAPAADPLDGAGPQLMGAGPAPGGAVVSASSTFELALGFAGQQPTGGQPELEAAEAAALTRPQAAAVIPEAEGSPLIPPEGFASGFSQFPSEGFASGGGISAAPTSFLRRLQTAAEGETPAASLLVPSAASLAETGDWASRMQGVAQGGADTPEASLLLPAAGSAEWAAMMRQVAAAGAQTPEASMMLLGESSNAAGSTDWAALMRQVAAAGTQTPEASMLAGFGGAVSASGALEWAVQAASARLPSAGSVDEAGSDALAVSAISMGSPPGAARWDFPMVDSLSMLHPTVSTAPASTAAPATTPTAAPASAPAAAPPPVRGSPRPDLRTPPARPCAVPEPATDTQQSLDWTVRKGAALPSTGSTTPSAGGGDPQVVSPPSEPEPAPAPAAADAAGDSAPAPPLVSPRPARTPSPGPLGGSGAAASTSTPASDGSDPLDLPSPPPPAPAGPPPRPGGGQGAPLREVCKSEARRRDRLRADAALSLADLLAQAHALLLHGAVHHSARQRPPQRPGAASPASPAQRQRPPGAGHASPRRRPRKARRPGASPGSPVQQPAEPQRPGASPGSPGRAGSAPRGAGSRSPPSRRLGRPAAAALGPGTAAQLVARVRLQLPASMRDDWDRIRAERKIRPPAAPAAPAGAPPPPPTIRELTAPVSLDPPAADAGERAGPATAPAQPQGRRRLLGVDAAPPRGSPGPRSGTPGRQQARRCDPRLT
eukprot:TRINITY_DN5580_c5_g3_i3.p1 TRINITY_DN5580_c5_g3~~TRINITY_DN5580_c5_g3_i3.p1  ORF type:complete len:1169 (+),score=207.99 TRINITY_DN5580_c5_g3_i3:83-3508(+)